MVIRLQLNSNKRFVHLIVVRYTLIKIYLKFYFDESCFIES